MKPLLIQLDEQTPVALNRVAAPDKRKRSDLDNLRTAARQWLESRAGVLPASRHIEVKRALGYALGWEELINLGSGATG